MGKTKKYNGEIRGKGTFRVWGNLKEREGGGSQECSSVTGEMREVIRADNQQKVKGV